MVWKGGTEAGMDIAKRCVELLAGSREIARILGIRDWRSVEREFRATRDPVMEVTLPKLKFLEDEQAGSGY